MLDLGTPPSTVHGVPARLKTCSYATDDPYAPVASSYRLAPKTSNLPDPTQITNPFDLSNTFVSLDLITSLQTSDYSLIAPTTGEMRLAFRNQIGGERQVSESRLSTATSNDDDRDLVLSKVKPSASAPHSPSTRWLSTELRTTSPETTEAISW